MGKGEKFLRLVLVLSVFGMVFLAIGGSGFAAKGRQSQTYPYGIEVRHAPMEPGIDDYVYFAVAFPSTNKLFASEMEKVWPTGGIIETIYVNNKATYILNYSSYSYNEILLEHGVNGEKKYSPATYTYYITLNNTSNGQIIARDPATGTKSFTVSTNRHTSITIKIIGEGTVVPFPATLPYSGIRGSGCDKTCTKDLTLDTTVTLVQYPARDWMFLRWGGDCTQIHRNSDCVVEVGPSKTVIAYFKPKETPFVREQKSARDKTSITIDFDEGYLGTRYIYFRGIPGGEMCQAKIKLRAYDTDGNKIGEATTGKGVSSHTGVEGRLYINDDTAYNKPVKKVVGTTAGDYWNKCKYIDNLLVSLYIP